ASMRQPLFTILCQTSTPQRQAYQSTRARASAVVWTAHVVNNSHSIGLVPAGGASSSACTAHNGTVGNLSRLRCRGGHKVRGQHRTARVAVRGGWAPPPRTL